MYIQIIKTDFVERKTSSERETVYSAVYSKFGK